MTECAKVDVVGVGLNATDTVIPVEKFPEPGSKVEYSRRTVLPGGQVATTVVACQTWGLRTRYVGKLGDDDAARLHKDAFRRVGAEAQIVTVPGSHSLHNVILIDARGERTVICQSNEHMVLQPGRACAASGSRAPASFTSMATTPPQPRLPQAGRVRPAFPSSPISMTPIPALKISSPISITSS